MRDSNQDPAQNQPDARLVEALSDLIASRQGEKRLKKAIGDRLADYTLNSRGTFNEENVGREVKSRIASSQADRDTRVGRKKTGRPILRWAAAVFAACIVAGGILWIGGDWSAQEPANTIARISEDVRLILPDGSEIILDNSTENSHIAEDGNTTFVREKGRLIQEKRADAVPVSSELQWGTIDVPRGLQFDMVLGDGTHVWLNAGSKLRFPTVFTQEERRVYLEGEGYFKVATDRDKPFTVETTDQTLTVYGTEFNVYAYSGETKVLTTLVSGSIGVTAKSTAEQKMLIPGQQLMLDKATNVLAVRAVDTSEESSWRNSLFIFDNNTLEQVFAKLARWYDLEYRFENRETADLIIRGNIPMFDDISLILKIIESSDKVVIEQSGNLLTIKPRK